MATVYAVTFVVLGLVVMYSSLVVWTALVLPGPVARARTRIETRPVASFFAGLAIFVLTVLALCGFFAAATIGWSSSPTSFSRVSDSLQFNRFHNDEYIIANCAAWPLLAAPAMVGWIIGGAAFAQLFASRARALMRDDRPLLALILGAITESFAFFLPAAGWFVFLPVVTLMSIGAGLLAILRPHAQSGSTLTADRRLAKSAARASNSLRVGCIFMTQLTRRQFAGLVALSGTVSHVGLLRAVGSGTIRRRAPERLLRRPPGHARGAARARSARFWRAAGRCGSAARDGRRGLH